MYENLNCCYSVKFFRQHLQNCSRKFKSQYCPEEKPDSIDSKIIPNMIIPFGLKIILKLKFHYEIKNKETVRNFEIGPKLTNQKTLWHQTKIVQNR
jgi:hypothetical protein